MSRQRTPLGWARRALCGVLVVLLVLAYGTAYADGGTASIASPRHGAPRAPRALSVAHARPTLMTDIEPPGAQVRAVLRLRRLLPGSVHLVVGTLVAGAPNQSVVAFGNKLACGAPGRPVSVELWNGTNIVRGRSDVVTHLRMLVTVPSGGSLDCSFRGYVASDVRVPGARANLRGGWLADVGAAGSPPTTAQRVLSARRNPLVSLGGATLRLPAVRGYVPGPVARSLLITADVYLTECHRRGGFCPKGPTYPALGVAVAQTWIVATPRRRGACTAWSSRPVTHVIDSNRHHQRAENTLRVPVTGQGCAPWDISVRARSTGGSTPFVMTIVGPYSTVTVASRRT